MTPRQRLLATLRGDPVDRPAVCFYEINALDQREDDPDPWAIHADPSWAPLLRLARERSDRIVMRRVGFSDAPPGPWDGLGGVAVREADGSRHRTWRLRAAGRELVERTRRDRDVDTVWTTEHLLKDADDLAALLALPLHPPGACVDSAGVLAAEAALGDSGICLIDTPDPLCLAAGLFDMGTYTVLAATEPELFGALVERLAAWLQPQVAAIAQALPGRLWRIHGPEYAVAPYLAPRWFRRYVVAHDAAMIAAIHRHGGVARVHCHGRITGVLADIVAMGADAIDPLEPAPQGDADLARVRAAHPGLVLFGDIEASELETLPQGRFRARAEAALAAGTGGRGFVLMPSASPYGRTLSPTALANYHELVAAAEGWRIG